MVVVRSGADAGLLSELLLFGSDVDVVELDVDEDEMSALVTLAIDAPAFSTATKVGLTIEDNEGDDDSTLPAWASVNLKCSLFAESDEGE